MSDLDVLIAQIEGFRNKWVKGKGRQGEMFDHDARAWRGEDSEGYRVLGALLEEVAHA